ncbi:DUF6001 family protein [Streptomyces sp. CRN 30]|uniref:DUF6001 family protein n=1 Tax=Streptomyces sp. CRN 30 TaxID=3075613 RepID=UPI002A822D60|nr:DUF6001 family protein [Streptomyces sp. CRN 30]
MIDEATSRAHVEAFLARRDRTLTDLTDQVADSFGAPLLTVATGSVQQGFGNDESDVDLLVFVDAQVTNIPISSHVLGLPVDINYLPVDWAGSVDDLLASPGYDGELVTFSDWKGSMRRFKRLARLACGLPLEGTEHWRKWLHGLAEPVTDYAISWWSRESLRLRTAARLSRETNPRLAAQRYCDAGLSALEVVAARAGEIYFGAKWIQPKLERSAAERYQDTYRFLLSAPTRAEEARSYHSAVEDLLAELLHPLPEDPVVQLALMPDVKRVEVRGRTLLHRWGAQGVESRTPDFAVPGADGVVWRGPAGSLDEDARLLGRQGLVWLSVADGGRA